MPCAYVYIPVTFNLFTLSSVALSFFFVICCRKEFVFTVSVHRCFLFESAGF